MDTSSSSGPRDRIYELKAVAQALQRVARAEGRTLARGAALEQVARERGFRDWNALAAAAKAAASSGLASRASWEDIDAPLPGLPMRFHRAGDQRYAAVSELMRWAQQLEYIGTKVPEDDRRHLIDLVGGDIPYVFVLEEDRRYQLCGRGYVMIQGVLFDRAQLKRSGVVAWQAKYGTHNGSTMLSVLCNEVRESSDSLVLRQAARLVATIARIADESLAQDQR